MATEPNGTCLSRNLRWVSAFCVTHQGLRSNTTHFLMRACRHIRWVTAQTACLTHLNSPYIALHRSGNRLSKCHSPRGTHRIHGRKHTDEHESQPTPAAFVLISDNTIRNTASRIHSPEVRIAGSGNSRLPTPDSRLPSSVFCLLSSVFCLLSSVFCILSSVFCILALTPPYNPY